MRDFRQPVGICVKTIVECGRDHLVFVGFIALFLEHVPDNGSAAADLTVDVSELLGNLGILDPSVVIDDGDSLGACGGYVLLAVLAVDCDEKVGVLTDKRCIFDRDLELLNHDEQIALLNGVSASVNELCIFAVLREKPLQCKARCERVRIRIIVTLNHDIFIV